MALYREERGLFEPGPAAASPWGPRLQHGGPPSGLLARAIEGCCRDPDLQLTRLTVDLFRPIPLEPIAVRAETVREGRRISVVQASILVGERETTRATGLLLRRSHTPALAHATRPPRGPQGLETTSLVPREVRGDAPEGFHTFVEARWARGEEDPRPAVWLRLPMPLVEGEEPSPLQRVAALSDFTNALGSLLSRRHDPGVGFINTDTTIYLTRPAEGEWLCLETDFLSERDGIGCVEAVQHDAQGRYGRSIQARLANR